MNKYTYYWIGGALALLAMVGFFAYQTKVYRTEISQFALSATMSDAAGVALESKFVLTSTADLSPQVLEKYIRITPRFRGRFNLWFYFSHGTDSDVRNRTARTTYCRDRLYNLDR